MIELANFHFHFLVLNRRVQWVDLPTVPDLPSTKELLILPGLLVQQLWQIGTTTFVIILIIIYDYLCH